MSMVVKAHEVSKSFSDFQALRRVSFEIQQGSIVGLIGPNGAGKTTTLKSLMGLSQFKGEMEVLGLDPRKGRHHLMERSCFIADVGILPGWIKVSQCLEYLKGVHPYFDESRALSLLKSTSIPLSKKVKQLSKGMVTQLHLALVMSIDVELLVLDEPTLGLDILYRKEFYDRLLNDHFDGNRTVIISTHQVEEIESLLSHLIFINQGEIVLECAMDELPNRFVEVEVAEESIEQARNLRPLHERDSLGKKSMLFQDVAAEQLAGFGQLHVPSVSDLFVAIMKGDQVK